jgi:TPR repeat protein
MPLINEKTCLALSLILSLVHTPSLFASADTSASIVKFQQTMAAKGHATAQYKLAMMYETGTGVEQNLTTARSWYQTAASQSYAPATHRLRYLDLAQNRAPADKDWLKTLHRDAKSGDGEAMLLLGQMYSHGTGVTQELNLASQYLRKARAENIPGSDAELSRVENTIKQQDELRAAEKRRTELASQRAQQKAEAQLAQQQRAQQKKLAEAQKIRQQPAHEKQAESKQPKPAPVTQTLAERKTALPAPPPGAVTEMDMSPCSGRYRFVSTCR